MRGARGLVANRCLFAVLFGGAGAFLACGSDTTAPGADAGPDAAAASTTSTPNAPPEDAGTSTDAAPPDAGTDAGQDAAPPAKNTIGPAPYELLLSGNGLSDSDNSVTQDPLVQAPDIVIIGDALVSYKQDYPVGVRTRGTNVASDLFADKRWLLGRWSGGTTAGDLPPLSFGAEGGFYYAVTAGSFGVSVQYNVGRGFTSVQTTPVTADDGSLAAGTATFQLGLYATLNNVQGSVKMTVTMPGDETYTAEQLPNSGLSGSSASDLSGGEAVTSTTACAVDDTCGVIVKARGDGDGVSVANDVIVLVFAIYRGPSKAPLRGAAVLAAD